MVVVVVMMVVVVILHQLHLCGWPDLRPRRVSGFQHCERIRNGFEQVPVAGRDRQLRLLGWRGLRSRHSPNGRRCA
jgi:hypothetical protein